MAIVAKIFTRQIYLKAGKSINDFLDEFPTVTREKVIYFLEELGRIFVSMAA
jgi:uncharacterized protein (DUF433 family)